MNKNSQDNNMNSQISMGEYAKMLQQRQRQTRGQQSQPNNIFLQSQIAQKSIKKKNNTVISNTNPNQVSQQNQNILERKKQKQHDKQQQILKKNNQEQEKSPENLELQTTVQKVLHAPQELKKRKLFRLDSVEDNNVTEQKEQKESKAKKIKSENIQYQIKNNIDINFEDFFHQNYECVDIFLINQSNPTKILQRNLSLLNNTTWINGSFIKIINYTEGDQILIENGFLSPPAGQKKNTISCQSFMDENNQFSTSYNTRQTDIIATQNVGTIYLNKQEFQNYIVKRQIIDTNQSDKEQNLVMESINDDQRYYSHLNFDEDFYNFENNKEDVENNNSIRQENQQNEKQIMWPIVVFSAICNKFDKLFDKKFKIIDNLSELANKNNPEPQQQDSQNTNSTSINNLEKYDQNDKNNNFNKFTQNSQYQLDKLDLNLQNTNSNNTDFLPPLSKGTSQKIIHINSEENNQNINQFLENNNSNQLPSMEIDNVQNNNLVLQQTNSFQNLSPLPSSANQQRQQFFKQSNNHEFDDLFKTQTATENQDQQQQQNTQQDQKVTCDMIEQTLINSNQKQQQQQQQQQEQVQISKSVIYSDDDEYDNNLNKDYTQYMKPSQTLIWFLGTNRFAIVDENKINIIPYKNREQNQESEELEQEQEQDQEIKDYKDLPQEDFQNLAEIFIQSFNFINPKNKQHYLKSLFNDFNTILQSHNKILQKNQNYRFDNRSMPSIVKIVITDQKLKVVKQKLENYEYYIGIAMLCQEVQRGKEKIFQILVKNLEKRTLDWIDYDNQVVFASNQNVPKLGNSQLLMNYLIDLQKQEETTDYKAQIYKINFKNNDIEHSDRKIALAFCQQYLMKYFFNFKEAQNNNSEVIFQNVLLQRQAKLNIQPKRSYNIHLADQRCQYCYYILEKNNQIEKDLKQKKCLYCGQSFHNHCILNLQVEETNMYTCYKCIPCRQCFGLINQKPQHCYQCRLPYHQKCCIQVTQIFDEDDRVQKISQQSQQYKDKWVCENCINCSMCQKKLHDAQYYVIEDQIICKNCRVIQKNKDFCPICKDNTSEREKQMILCNNCQMWIHEECDSYLQGEGFQKYQSQTNTNKMVYQCSPCRKKIKRKELINFMNIIECMDYYAFFQQDSIKDFQSISKNYLDVIKNPIGIKTIKTKIKQGIFDDKDTFNLLQQDFNTMIQNAFTFNMPSTQVYIEAKKLLLLGQQAFNFFKQDIMSLQEDFLVKLNREVIIDKEKEFFSQIQKDYLNIISQDKHQNNENVKLYFKKRKDITDKISLEKNEEIQLPELEILSQFEYPKILQGIFNNHKDLRVQISDIEYILEIYSKKGEKQQQMVIDILKHKVFAKKDIQNPYLIYILKQNEIKEEEQKLLDQQKIEEENTQQMIPQNNQFLNSQYSKELQETKLSTIINKLIKENNSRQPLSFFEPVLIKYTWAELVHENCCFLCGSFSNNNDYIQCQDCQEFFHLYCLIPGKLDKFQEKIQIIKENAMKKQWSCPRCKVCQVCQLSNGDFLNSLVCKKCDDIFHFDCLYPQIQKKDFNIDISNPQNGWLCQKCFECELCSTNQIIDPQIQFSSIYFEFCQNQKYCYTCGLLQAKNNFCQICQKYCNNKTVVNKNNYKQNLQIMDVDYDNVPLDDYYDLNSLCIVYFCKECKALYHKKCYDAEYPNTSFFSNNEQKKEIQNSSDLIQIEEENTDEKDQVCFKCVDNTINKLQKKYEKALVESKRQIYYLKRQAQIFPIFKNMIIRYDQSQKNNEQYMQEFIIQELQFFESEEYNNYCEQQQVLSFIENKFLQGDKLKLNTQLLKYFLEDQINFENYSYNQFPKDPDQPIIFNNIYQYEIDSIINKDLYTHNCSKFHEFIETYTVYNEVRIKVIDIFTQNTQKIHVQPKTYLSLHKFPFTLNYNIIKSIQKTIERLISQKMNITIKISENNDPYHVIQSNQPLLRDNKYGYFSLSQISQLQLQFELDNHNPLTQKYQFWPISYYMQKAKINYYKFHLQYNKNQSILQEKKGFLIQINQIKHVYIPNEIKQQYYLIQQQLKSTQQNQQFSQLFEQIEQYNISIKQIFKQNEIETQINLKKEQQKKLKMLERRELASIYVQIYKISSDIVDKIVDKFNDFLDLKEEQLREKQSIQKQQKIEEERKNQEQEHQEIYGNSLLEPQVKKNQFYDNFFQKKSYDTEKFYEQFLQQLIKNKKIQTDDLIDSPLNEVQCFLCHVKGNRRQSGRLLNADVDTWVHANCALYSDEVIEDFDGGLQFEKILKRSTQSTCGICKQSGASISCFQCVKDCKVKMHFPCILQSQKANFLSCKRALCEKCVNQLILDNSNENSEQYQIPYFYLTSHQFQAQLKQQQHLQQKSQLFTVKKKTGQLVPFVKLVTDFSTSRRLYILQGQKNQRLIEYTHECFNRFGNTSFINIVKSVKQQKKLTDYYSNHMDEIMFKNLMFLKTVYNELNQKNEVYSFNFDYNLKNDLIQVKFKNLPLEEIYTNTQKKINNQDYAFKKKFKQPSITNIQNNEPQNSDSEDEDFFDNNDDVNIFENQVYIRQKKQIELHNIQNNKIDSKEVKLYQKNQLSEKILFKDCQSVNLQNFGDYQNLINQNFKLNSNNTVEIFQNKVFSKDQELAKIGDFLGIYSFLAKHWIQTIEDTQQEVQQNLQDLNVTQIRDYFYKEIQVEHINPFEKQHKIQQIHKRILEDQKIHLKEENTQQLQTANNDVPLNKIPLLKKKKIASIPSIVNIQKAQSSTNQEKKAIKPKKQAANNLSSQKLLSRITIRYDEILHEKDLQYDQEKQNCSKEKEFEKKIKNQYDKWITQKEMRHQSIYVAPSNIHKYGLFSKKPFEPDTIVIEYVGERIRNSVADSREIFYEQQGFGDCYMFRANQNYVIDASFRGNQARYLNHSCDSKCSSIILDKDTDQPKIIIYARKYIKEGDEITYDYNFEAEAGQQLKCTCGAKNCQGRLN